MFRPVVAIIRFFLSFDSLKIILHNSRGGVFDKETSTSKPYTTPDVVLIKFDLLMISTELLETCRGL